MLKLAVEIHFLLVEKKGQLQKLNILKSLSAIFHLLTLNFLGIKKVATPNVMKQRLMCFDVQSFKNPRYCYFLDINVIFDNE